MFHWLSSLPAWVDSIIAAALVSVAILLKRPSEASPAPGSLAPDPEKMRQFAETAPPPEPIKCLHRLYVGNRGYAIIRDSMTGMFPLVRIRKDYPELRVSGTPFPDDMTIVIPVCVLSSRAELVEFVEWMREAGVEVIDG